jgi:hypothetical protein
MTALSARTTSASDTIGQFGDTHEPRRSPSSKANATVQAMHRELELAGLEED